ncbi:MAG: hypothetical protein MI919_06755, partial [Holophagales bacterium]|nr:hypothetical protein [Holophagales bacterium]
MPEIGALTGRPLAGEYADYAREDIEYVDGDDGIAVLEEVRDATLELFGSLDDASVAGLTYAPG